VVSYATKPRPVNELEGLVYGVSKLPDEHDDFWYQKPIVWAGIVGAVFVVLNIIFW
jgi:SSS family solute:Na+ symporter